LPGRPECVRLGQDVRLIAGYEHEIRFHDVMDGEHHVDWREKDPADAWVTRQEISDRKVQPPNEVLVPQVRRGGHVVDPVYDLVPKPIVLREQQ
jgi:hypothetical protein